MSESWGIQAQLNLIVQNIWQTKLVYLFILIIAYFAKN